MGKLGPGPGGSGGGGRRRSSGNCVGCRKRDTGENIDNWVQCDDEGCAEGGAWWHDKCAGVNAADLEGSALWSCPHCVRVRQEASRVRDQAVSSEDEVRTIGGTQEEDEHGYAGRRAVSPPAAPPQIQPDLP